jgi:hypothetical protein
MKDGQKALKPKTLIHKFSPGDGPALHEVWGRAPIKWITFYAKLRKRRKK